MGVPGNRGKIPRIAGQNCTLRGCSPGWNDRTGIPRCKLWHAYGCHRGVPATAGLGYGRHVDTSDARSARASKLCITVIGVILKFVIDWDEFTWHTVTSCCPAATVTSCRPGATVRAVGQAMGGR